MKRDYEREVRDRVGWIKAILAQSGAKGIIYGNSGGKDSVLVAALCNMATDNLIGVIMPCGSKQNFGSDMEDGLTVAKWLNIKTLTVDLSQVKETLCDEIIKGFSDTGEISEQASININPRLRMTSLYTIGQSNNYLVAGTGNASEIYMGYFTKWGDGAFDFNPISDLSVTEVYEFLKFLNAPEEVIKKAPSAGLYEGQTDEKDMGVSYKAIDNYMATGEGTPEDIAKIERAHKITEHKRKGFLLYPR